MIQDIAPHKLDNQYHPDRRPRPDDTVMAFQGKKLLCRTEDQKLELLRVRDLPDEKLVYLFSIDDEAFYLAHDDADFPKGFEFQEFWRRRWELDVPQEIMFAIATASHLEDWYRTNRYCGCCGERTVHAEDERALVCPECGNRIYPRLMPAVIIGVTNGDELLITRYSDRPLPYYALVAGFVEIGETLEECVAREVMEEVGLSVKNIRYYKSQPWGIADDVLAGFYCDVDGDPTVHLDERELREGIWVRRGEVPLQPDNFSLTCEMMRMFNEGRNN